MEPVEVYKIWWRCAEDVEFQQDLKRSSTCEYTLSQLQTKLKGQNVTELKIEGSIPPNLHALTPNLKNLALSYLPDNRELNSLCSLTWLEVLDLSNNDLSSCSDLFEGFKSLKKLSVHGCHLDNLPISISSLTKLTALDASDNNSLNNVAQFQWPPSLKELNLGGCQINHLSESFGVLSQLETLELSNSDFSAGLPEAVTELKELKQLGLPYCQLETLPDRFSQLQKLEELDLSCNTFTTVSDSVTSLSSLQVLNLNECKLESLPESLGGLQQLIQLHLTGNNLESLPDSLYTLHNLQLLNLAENHQLRSLNPKLKNLRDLEKIDLKGCLSLTFPPYDPRSLGLLNIQQYYTRTDRQSLPVTVAVIGYSQAGKTSIINSLKENQRVVTDRHEDSWFDTATKAFDMKDVSVDNSTLRFVDFGGHEIYHVTYQLTFRESCIPVIVVSMRQYEQLSELSDNPREAVRKLMLDWVSHLYMAQSDLSKPTLIFTNKDAYNPEKFEDLKSQFFDVLHEAWSIMVSEATNLPEDLFKSIPVFEVGYPEDEYVVFNEIKHSLYQLATQKQTHSISPLWINVAADVRSLKKEYHLLEGLFGLLKTSYKGLSKDDFYQILAYMNDCGMLLWYNNITELKDYVFTNIPAVTKLLTVWYDHNEEENWQRRVKNFTKYSGDSHRLLERDKYEELVQSFRETGLADKTLFHHLVAKETIFKTESEIDVAVNLLRSFKLLYKTKERNGEIGYLIPNFARGWVESLNEKSAEIKLHFQIKFVGLPPPLHIYHQMTVALLEAFFCENDTSDVKFNGVFIYRKDTTIRFIHDAKTRTVTIQLAGFFDKIHLCWSQLMEASRIVIQQTPSTSRTTEFSCPHCILKGDLHPQKDENPSWFKKFIIDDAGWMESGIDTVNCHGDQVPCALKYPCQDISSREVKELQKHVSLYTEARKQRDVADNQGDGKEQLELLQSLDTSKEDIGTRSESEHFQGRHSDTYEVFKMSSPIKGRVLIINNRTFTGGAIPERTASEVDVDHITKLFKAFNFEVVVKCDLTAKEMAATVRMETYDASHADYDMFILVMMSHGVAAGSIYGVDMRVVQLNGLLQLLSRRNFPHMKDKPKLVIVHACSPSELQPAKQTCHKSEEEARRFCIDDMLLMHSTSPSTCDMEDSKLGSIFIRCLVARFSKDARNMDVKSLMEKIKKRTLEWSQKCSTDCSDDDVCIADFLTSNRKLYLFPDYNRLHKS